MNKAILEILADKQHQIWAHWMKYLFLVSVKNADGSYTIPVASVHRWQRQMETDYNDLSEKEKNSDREQADKILRVLKVTM